MDRFVALVWNRCCEARSRQAGVWRTALHLTSPDWSLAVDAPGLCVFVLADAVGPARVTRMDGAEGLVIGRLFRRNSEASGQASALDAVTCSKVAGSGGVHLLTAYWGSFLALWRDARSQTTHIVRDPMGGTPCFKTRAAGIDIFCAYIDDIVGLLPGHFSIDWRYIRRFLADPYVCTRQTGLCEVEEVMPGERISVDSEGHVEKARLWKGEDHAAHPSRLSFDEAAHELRDITEACLTAWGLAHRRVIVRISGGLDSSIILNVLRQVSSARVTGFHLVGRDYEASELNLARAAADQAAVELVEIDTSLGETGLADIFGDVLLARPTRQIFGADVDRRTEDVCMRLGASCVIAGHGGDTLFLQQGLAGNILADHLRLRGLGVGTLGVAYRSATLMQTSIWHVLASGLRKGLAARRSRILGSIGETAHAATSLLVSREALDRDAATDVASGDTPETVGLTLPPGKALQASALARLSHYHGVRGLAVRRDTLSPFLSQPIVEFSLRTPTYILSGDGIDRALERHAFANILPPGIRQRTGKGFVNHHLSALIAHSLPDVRALILGGGLIRQDWIRRSTVERLLSDDHILTGDALPSVLALIAAEVWLRAYARYQGVSR